MTGKLTTLVLLLAPLLAGQEFRAGTARVKITPRLPVRLAGFGNRTAPARTVWMDLYAKALALGDARGERFVVVSLDLLGISREISDEVAARLKSKRGLERRQVLFSVSHTHSGPGLLPNLCIYPYDSPEDREQARLYGLFLMDQLEAVTTQALDAMRPATLASAWGEAGFAVNRRTLQLKQIRPGESFPAPIDHRVPVLKVSSADGAVLALLFAYACHNTTMTGDTNEVNSDYAGIAQAELERAYPGSTALFVTLCAGDQRVMPRGTRELTVMHGKALATAVQAALGGKLRPLHGALRSAYELGELPFEAHGRDVYQAEAHSSDLFLSLRGRRMIDSYAAGKPILSTPYPVEAFAVGRDFVLVALGGEVVVDYDLRFTREYPRANLVVAAYSNDVMGYIPSLRIWREGGYESGDAMMYYKQPGWFTDQVEEIVSGLVHRALDQVGFKR